jgi:hypothetical protein
LLHGSADCGRYTFWALRDTLRYCLSDLLVFPLLISLLCFGFALGLFLTTLLDCSSEVFSFLRCSDLVIYGQLLGLSRSRMGSGFKPHVLKLVYEPGNLGTAGVFWRE